MAGKTSYLNVDGKGYAGQIIDFVVNTDEMAARFNLVSYDWDVLALFGVLAGNTLELTVREWVPGAAGAAPPGAHTIRGTITEIAEGDGLHGALPHLAVRVSLTYYRLKSGDDVVHEAGEAPPPPANEGQARAVKPKRKKEPPRGGGVAQAIPPRPVLSGRF